MKIIPFPGGSAPVLEKQWQAELDAALSGDGTGSEADMWRELRSDVRALAPTLDPEFEDRLRARILGRSQHTPTADTVRIDDQKPHISTSRTRLSKRQLARLRSPRLAWLGVLTPIAAVFVAVLLLTGTHRHRQMPGEVLPRSSSASAVGAMPKSSAVSSGPLASPGRVQQLTASITLSASPNDVRSIAAQVARLAVSDGGFVQSSHVQTQRQGAGEAALTLNLPSAKLSAALSSLDTFAQVRQESQSSQDITGSYDSARRGLADALAERQALLRVLSHATTEGQIDSLREQLSQVRGAIGRARSAVHRLSQQASIVELEVAVVGEAHKGSEGLTLERGLSDAERVLFVGLITMLIALATIAPVAIALAILTGALRRWRRYQREHTLDAY